MATFRDGIAYPHVLKPGGRSLDLANSLIALFHDAIGRRRFDVEEEIKAFNIEKTHPKVIQGLAELLLKRCTFDETLATKAVELRRQLFSASATYWKSGGEKAADIMRHRQNILRAAAQKSATPLEVGEQQLFGDIASNQCLASFDTLTAEQLINRFNIAQVQGLLLDARSLEIRVPRQQGAALKQLMQMLKFHQLLFALIQADNNSFVLQIDGPGSILENSRSYGIEVATFFPAVLLLKGPWQLTALLKIPSRRRIFTLTLTEESPYRSYLQPKNIWTHERTAALLERFNEKYNPDYSARLDADIIQLKDNRYLLPDFTVLAERNSGKGKPEIRMQVEWVHYPSASKFKWLQQVKPQLPDNYVFAVRGKGAKMKQLADALEPHLLLYTKELTAPAILRKLETFSG